MSLSRIVFYAQGMTCGACEARISKALIAIPGVSSAQASLKGGRVSIEYDADLVDLPALRKAIEAAGYPVREGRGAGTTLALGAGLLLVAAYLFASSRGVFNSLPIVDSSIGYAMLFVVGLLTSIHCVAMCGGIALSQSVPLAMHGPAEASQAPSRLESLRPGLLYNGGRLLSYTLIGGLVGGIGSAFSFSPAMKGGLAAAAGLFMVLLGLKMLGVLKGLPRLSSLLPKGARQALGGLSSRLGRQGPFAVGVLNGLMPCGPLQTMQLYALGTGSILAGALSMFIFAAGTIPLMLVFGATAALLPRKFLPAMMRASAVLVMFLGVVTFARAAALAGLALPELVSPRASIAPLAAPASPGYEALEVAATAPGGPAKATVSGGVQTIVTEIDASNYRNFTVQAGLPLKWTVRVSAANLNGCNNTILVPAYGIKKPLKVGDNLIEFTPKAEGPIAYSCWMGMIRNRITVVKDLGQVAANPGAPASGGADPSLAAALAEGNGALPAAGSCCSTASANAAFAGGRVPVDTIGLPVVEKGIQVITVTVSPSGYSPAAFVLEKGSKAIVRFKAEGLSSCNNPVVFPEYNGSLDLARGQLETPAIPVTGDFTFSCWMGMLHGYIKVVDDLKKVDLAKVKAEIGAWKAPAGSACCGGSTATAQGPAAPSPKGN